MWPAWCPLGTSQERSPSSLGPPDAAATSRPGSENGGTPGQMRTQDAAKNKGASQAGRPDDGPDAEPL